MIVVDPNDRIMQDSTWADGLRGIAAIYVAISHVVLCFGRQFTLPCCADDATRTPWLFQRPILRLIACGHSWVAIFFVLLGLVNTLKPIRQARSGDAESALLSLSTAAFRRSFRLVLPASTATIISWFLCQLGLYERARTSDAWWLFSYTPMPSESYGVALVDLVEALMGTWRPGGSNAYDQPQWALNYLLQGSIMAFFVMMATVQLTSFWRSVTIGLCLFWSWSWTFHLHDPLVGYTVLGGILLAEFSISSYPANLVTIPGVSMVAAPVLALVGLVLMSFPGADPGGAPWSASLKYFFINTFPTSVTSSIARLSGSTGALMLCFAIIISPHMRRALAVKQLRWLGKLSFPIYLLHGTALRTVLAWFVFAGQPLEQFTLDGAPYPSDGPKDGVDAVYRYTTPGTGRIAVGIVLFFAVTLYASHLWANNLEPIFGKITFWAESKVKRQDDGPMMTATMSQRSPIE